MDGAAAEAASAGWAVLVKEGVANGRLTPGPAPEPVTALAQARGVTADAIALAAALARPWASVVLSGAVTEGQLAANLAALTVGPLPALDLAEEPAATGPPARPGRGSSGSQEPGGTSRVVSRAAGRSGHGGSR